MKIFRFKKIIATLLVLAVLFGTVASIFPSQSHAEPVRGTWYYPDLDTFLTKVGDAEANEIFGERYTFAQVNWIIHSLYFILAGPISRCADEGSPPAIAACVSEELNNGGTASGGIILPIAALSDTLMRTKPVSGVDYVASKLEKFNIIDSAYAQQGGFGYENSLIIIQPLWVGIRDAAYSLVIFAILILAFMIMLRAKLSPQAVVTVQSALPNIAIGLVLITFSYAIAGFMIDIVFVLQGLLAAVIVNADLSNKGNVFEVFNALNGVMGGLFSYAIAFLLQSVNLFSGITAGAGLTAGLFFAPIATIASAVLVIIVIAVVFFIAFIRIVWLQLKTFTAVILLVIASPLIMLVGIVRPKQIGAWFRNMAANLSVFFSISLMVFLAHYIYFSTNDHMVDVIGSIELPSLASLWTPDHFGIEFNPGTEQAANFPTGFAWGSLEIIGLVLSFGLILSVPKMAEAVKDYIAKGGGQFGFDTTGTILGGSVGSQAYRLGSSQAGTFASRAELRGGEGAGKKWRGVQTGLRWLGSNSK